MSDTTNVNLRLDKELKAQSEALFAKLGINMTSALNMFLRQAVREQAIPFKVSAKPEAYPVPPEMLSEMNSYPTYDDYVAAKLKQADIEAAEDPTRYTHEEVFGQARTIIDESRKKLGL